ncbi:phosphopantetheine-binding protein [Micromonospora sp. NPDC049374]|uniref:acyl carrier protein n=1 Tax=Micromonospora sp. NPDC049374 TaxID=3154352 RepID=UPI0034441528
MSHNDPGAVVAAFLQQRFPQVEIAHDEDIFALGLVNSLFALELVMFVEKTFGFTLPSDEMRIDSFRSIDAIGALVGRQTATV